MHTICTRYERAVNTRQVPVINGAMRFLCSRIVDTILMEVEYTKKRDRSGCNGPSMLDTLATMGFEIKDDVGKDVSESTWQNLPENVAFQQKYRDQPPCERLRGQPNSPCAPFCGDAEEMVKDMKGWRPEDMKDWRPESLHVRL